MKNVEYYRHLYQTGNFSITNEDKNCLHSIIVNAQDEFESTSSAILMLKLLSGSKLLSIEDIDRLIEIIENKRQKVFGPWFAYEILGTIFQSIHLDPEVNFYLRYKKLCDKIINGVDWDEDGIKEIIANYKKDHFN